MAEFDTTEFDSSQFDAPSPLTYNRFTATVTQDRFYSVSITKASYYATVAETPYSVAVNENV